MRIQQFQGFHREIRLIRSIEDCIKLVNMIVKDAYELEQMFKIAGNELTYA